MRIIHEIFFSEFRCRKLEGACYTQLIIAYSFKSLNVCNKDPFFMLSIVKRYIIDLYI